MLPVGALGDHDRHVDCALGTVEVDIDANAICERDSDVALDPHSAVHGNAVVRRRKSDFGRGCALLKQQTKIRNDLALS
jgi:hypothetical protein